MIAEEVLKKKINPYLKFISERVRENIRMHHEILREVTSNDERIELIKKRSKIYNNNMVSEPCNSHDPFDIKARFFVLENKGQNPKYLRAVNRNSLGNIPTELNLKPRQELIDFFTRYDRDVNHDVLKESTLDPTSKDNLSNLMRRYNNSKKVYEIGGLFGEDDKPFNSLELILGIGQIGCEEQWDLVVQTNHTGHLGVYQIYPYRLLNGSKDLKSGRKGFSDYCQRHGQIITLEGEEFREAYEKFQIDCANLPEPESEPCLT